MNLHHLRAICIFRPYANESSAFPLPVSKVSVPNGKCLIPLNSRFSPERPLQIVQSHLQIAAIPQLQIVECVDNEDDALLAIESAG